MAELEIDFEGANEGITTPEEDGWRQTSKNVWFFSEKYKNTKLRMRAEIKRKGPRMNPMYYGIMKNLRTGKIMAKTNEYKNRKPAKLELNSLRNNINKEVLN